GLYIELSGSSVSAGNSIYALVGSLGYERNVCRRTPRKVTDRSSNLPAKGRLPMRLLLAELLHNLPAPARTNASAPFIRATWAAIRSCAGDLCFEYLPGLDHLP